MIHYQFDQKKKILEVHYEGIIDLAELKKYGDQICNDKKLPRNLNILTDVTKATYNIQPNEINEALQILKKQVKCYDRINAAFIHKAPKETALSILMESELNGLNYFHKVFSTKDAALQWLEK